MDTHPKPRPRLDWSSPPIISALNFSWLPGLCHAFHCFVTTSGTLRLLLSTVSQRLHTPLPAFQNHCLLSMESSKFAFDSFFKDRISWTPDWSWTHYVAEEDLELLIFLPYLSNTEVIGMCNVRYRAQGFVHARQTLCQLNYIFSHLALLCWDRVLLGSPNWPGIHHVDHTGLEFVQMILVSVSWVLG